MDWKTRLAVTLIAGLTGTSWAQQQRTTMGPPVRTGIPGQQLRVTNSPLTRSTTTSPMNGYRYWQPGYGWSGVSLQVEGDGWSLNVNGNLANELAYNRWGTGHAHHGYGNGGCMVVPDADDVLPTLPSWLRDRVHVLHGSDYGWTYDVICFPRWNGNSWVYVPIGYGYGYYPSGYYYRDGGFSVYETSGWGTMSSPSSGQQQQQTLPPPEPPRPIDIARLGVVLGDLQSAEAQYRIHLRENPGDSEALREFGLVMLEQGRVDEGFAAIRKAYRDRPELARAPLPLADLGFDGARTRALMGTVSPAANQLKTSSGWFTLATLLQAQDKGAQALKMIERAAEQGLEQPVADTFRSVLKR
ncbi:MAG: tetratricopeptide repeat protein [Phycisphaerales bacterium]|nr:tetratricopeptide repeat protein [Phycisphaerales bacterium]